MNELKKRYFDTIKPELEKSLGIKNAMKIPELKKVVINVSLGEAIREKKVVDEVVKQITLISGQKPVVTKAKKSIATFKLAQGMPIGVKVTLRNEKMYDFFQKMVTIVFVRIRDFRGVAFKGFDSEANYTVGFTEQIVFPEVDYSSIDKLRGLQVTMVTSTKEVEHAKALLKALGMPFERVKEQN